MKTGDKDRLFILFIPLFTLFLFDKIVCSLWLNFFSLQNDRVCFISLLDRKAYRKLFPLKIKTNLRRSLCRRQYAFSQVALNVTYANGFGWAVAWDSWKSRNDIQLSTITAVTKVPFWHEDRVVSGWVCCCWLLGLIFLQNPWLPNSEWIWNLRVPGLSISRITEFILVKDTQKFVYIKLS